jgi:hypothetical protein
VLGNGARGTTTIHADVEPPQGARHNGKQEEGHGMAAEVLKIHRCRENPAMGISVVIFVALRTYLVKIMNGDSIFVFD